MSVALTTVTNLFISPPHALVDGGVLFGIVWGFFKGVESVLADDTKFEIAVWLVGVKVGQKVEPWPDTFAKVFDRVFGKRHLSWRCFIRSAVVSSSMMVGAGAWITAQSPANEPLPDWRVVAVFVLPVGICVDYGSLLKTRLLLSWIQRLQRPRRTGVVLALDLYLSMVVTCFFMTASFYAISHAEGGFFGRASSELSVNLFNGVHSMYTYVLNSPLFLLAALFLGPVFSAELRDLLPLYLYPAFFAGIWLWLYAGPGFLLKAARRFDIGFQWFNRKFDIEKKPLSAIGLVAGALVAIVYWAAVIVNKALSGR